MLEYKNIIITKVDTRDSYYDNKKNKSIKYKNPQVTEKIICEVESCYDLGEFYEILKFHNEKNCYSQIKVSFDMSSEY